MNQEMKDLNLIKYYINVSNTALAQSEFRSTLMSRRAIVNMLAAPSTVALRIADGDTVSDDVYVTRFIDGQFTPVEKGNGEDADSEYTLQRSFLEEVMRRSRDYIDNPSRLDWGWMEIRTRKNA